MDHLSHGTENIVLFFFVSKRKRTAKVKMRENMLKIEIKIWEIRLDNYKKCT